MSTQSYPTMSPLSDKSVELVAKLIAKTQGGRLIWQKSPNGLFANIPGLTFNFVEASPGYPAPRWLLFSVRDDKSTEILKVENPPLGRIGDPLFTAVGELYRLVRTNAKGDIDKAIDLIDKI